MKKVIFICVVSLTLCFVAGNNEVPQTKITPAPKKVEVPSTTVPAVHAETSTTAPVQSTSSTTAKPNDAGGDKSSTTTTTTTTTTTAPAPNTTTSVPQLNTNSTTTSSLTTTSTTTSTTPKVEISTKAPEPKQARGFDGPSFIGGIILALGLLAIGYMGFRYYRNQTERNYHTL